MKRIVMVGALAALCLVGVPLSLHLIFYEAPILDVLYFNQKIFYWHVPCAWMLFASVFTCGIASLLFLFKRRPGADAVAEASAELAVLFGAIVLITGSIWGKAAWNVWWQWDARLTSSLLLWMIMLGVTLVRQFGGPGSDRLAAGLAVFGMVDVPLIYFSVKIWRTIHPDTTVVPGLQGSMKTAFWVSGLLMTALFGLLLAARLGASRAGRRLTAARERAIDTGLFD